jgi:cellulose synthase operon protein C
MTPFDRRPTHEAPLEKGEPATSSKQGTLPPPEWRSGNGSPRTTVAPPPLLRRSGSRAEEAWMRARVEEARAGDDPAALRSASVALARWLASRDRDLDEAVRLATVALSLGDEIELRRETAAWLESLGQSARAAGVLKPIAWMPDVESQEASYVLVRTGILKARAGEAAGAAAAFDAAASIDGAEALPAELLGALSAWPDTAVPAAEAAETYVEAARRRAAAAQYEAELEDLWRAFAIAPASEAVASALARALETRRRAPAAAEVLRLHTRAVAAVDPPRWLEAREAWRAGLRSPERTARSPFVALGEALDRELDRAIDGADGEAFDALLGDARLLDVVAARLEVRGAQASTPGERAVHLVELGHLCAGPLADDDRAEAAYAGALAADPTSEAAEAGQRALAEERQSRPATTGDPGAAMLAREWVAASLSRDAAAQALALERLAGSSPPALRPLLLAVASERSMVLGDRASARRVAERATQAEPTELRGVAALAEAVLEDRDLAAATALERAVALIGPRPAWCAALADALDALGESESSVGWAQRCVSLRPGDRAAIVRLVNRLLAAKDPSRLGDALAWLLAQPQPAAWLAQPFARALRMLAQLDPDRAAVVARRTLDVLGPDSEPVREAMLDVAARASDHGFAAAIFERWLSCGAQGADRGALYVTLADLREHLGDEESEVRVIARAIREGVASPELDAHLDRLADRPATPDAQLWRMQAKAERVATGSDPAAAAWAWRDFGAALWDLADDRKQALEAWRRAARSEGGRDYATLALDLVAFSDPKFAFEWLRRAVDDEADDAVAASIAVEGARAALSIAEFRHAFDFAARGVARCPARADALELAERAATQPGEQAALSGLYTLVATRALGRFGRRAAHYRGARCFERRGEHGLALKHAAQAFSAVPSEGSSFQLLARAAERAGDRAQAVQTIEQVAELADRSEARTAWLLRAASIAGEGEEGARRKVDVLLRAALSSPSVAVIALLRDAGRDLLRFGPEERTLLEMRLGRAARAITDRLEGPDGGRVAIAFARTSLELFSDADGGLASLERAFACDADIDEYAELEPWSPTLAGGADARERTTALLASAETAHANLGIAALRLLASIATAGGDGGLEARTAIAAALRDPEDDALVIEADAAARGVPALEARLAKRVPQARRAEAILAAARARVGERAHAEAASLFERALELTEEPLRAPVERELRSAWEAAGRIAEIEARVQRDAASEAASPSARADHWAEIAERRESRGDTQGAVRALMEACKLDEEPLERWSALERVAEAAGDDGVRVTALEAIAMRVGARGRVAVFKRLARAHERQADFEAAERAWQRVLALDPEDEEADHAVEASIVERGRYDELADHLARRAARLGGQSEKKEMLRAVRLRRAAILEQRLGREQDACDELSLLLAEWPSSPGALRYLADLLERRGEHAKAVPLWQRAAELETDPAGSDELELRAGRAALASGDMAAALEHATRIRPNGPAHGPALELRVAIARRLGEDQTLGDALDELAAGEAVDPLTRSDLLLEAAQASARAGNPRGALERAMRSAEAAPDRATPQLLARALEYRMRGAGAPDEARRTIDELGSIREPIEGPDAALRAFLLAEALDVVQGRGAGLRELEAARALIGDHPLLGLGLAERFAATGQASAAVDEYRVALRGSLLDLRKAGTVALHAAEAALRADREQDAAHFLDLAQTDPDSRAQAQSIRARLRDRAKPSPPEPPPPVEAGPDRRVDEIEAAVRAAATPAARALARHALARVRLEAGDPVGAEPLLWEALADGLAEAGDALAPLLSVAPDRARDVVRLRRQQVALEPGDVGRLELLRAAALADEDRVYARAVEHVLRAFDPGAGPLPPPPLVTQPEQPGIFALLTRPSRDAAGEALAALWESSPHLFARDPGVYSIGSLERVVPGPTSAVARVYEVALRLLDVPRVPLYLTALTSAAPTSQVALMSPPSLLLSGDVREEGSALRFALGRGLSAAISHNVLRLGVSPAEGAALVDAIRAAFGPPELGRRVDAQAARLAQSFWQTVPARTQRRLQELLGGGNLPDHPELVARAEQSGRRVGMFLGGDFGWAARQLVAEAPLLAGMPPSLDSLRALCDSLSPLADLLRLAVSPEYAEARWHVVAPGPQRGMISSGRFSLF